MKTKLKILICSAIAIFSIVAIVSASWYIGCEPADLEYFLKIRLKPKDVYPMEAGGTVAYARNRYFMHNLDLPLTNSIDLYAYVCDPASMVAKTDKISWSCSNPYWKLETTENGEKTTVNFKVSGTGTVFATINFKHPHKNETKKFDYAMNLNVATNLPPRILFPPLLPKMPEPAKELIYIDTRHHYLSDWNGYISHREGYYLTNQDNSVTLVSNGFTDVEATVNGRKINHPMRLFVQAFQGLINREKPRIITYGGTLHTLEPENWKDWILSNGYSISKTVFYTNIGSIFYDFTNSPNINGFIKYSGDLFTNDVLADVIHWVTAAAGVSNLLPITDEIFDLMPKQITNHWPILIDTDDWIAENNITNSEMVYFDSYKRWWPKCNHTVIAKEHPWYSFENRDYWVAQKIWPFFWRRDCSTNEYELFTKMIRDEMPVHSSIIGVVGAKDRHVNWYCRLLILVYNEKTKKTRMVDFDSNQSNPNVIKHFDSNGNTINYQNSTYQESTYEVVLKTSEIISQKVFQICQPVYLNVIEEYGGKVGVSETAWWRKISELGKLSTYSYVPNWSFHAGINWENIKPTPLRSPPEIITNIENKIYCCAFVSDGDNFGWDSFVWKSWWEWEDNNNIDVARSYGFNLLMYDIAPLQMLWYHKNETPKRRIDADHGAGTIQTKHYGDAFGKHDQILNDYMRLTDIYLEKSGINIVRPQFGTKRSIYDAYSQLKNAIGLGGSYEVHEEIFNPMRPTNVNGKVWLLNEGRMRLTDWNYTGTNKFLIRKMEDLTPNKPQFHSVWNYNWFYPERWIDWIDIQTDFPPKPDPDSWRRNIPLKIICPETMVEMLK